MRWEQSHDASTINDKRYFSVGRTIRLFSLNTSLSGFSFPNIVPIVVYRAKRGGETQEQKSCLMCAWLFADLLMSFSPVLVIGSCVARVELMTQKTTSSHELNRKGAKTSRHAVIGGKVLLLYKSQTALGHTKQSSKV